MPLAGLPHQSTSPESAASVPVMMLMRVLLPAPLGPKRPYKPGPRVRETPDRAFLPLGWNCLLDVKSFGVW